MASNSTIPQDLATIEAHLVDWKARAKRYEDKQIAVPKHIRDRIELLKEDALLLRKQLTGEHQ